MQFIQGKDREQSVLFPLYLDQIVSADNEVRVIDAFVNSINTDAFGFKVKSTVEGRPAFNPKDLLKLFVYGYLNRIRSSRVLEKECYRNIEIRWLLKELAPDHNTISNFRRDNADAIKKVFRYTVSLAKNFNLIGGALVAGDSTKLRAQNSKKNNFNPKKLEKHIAYIDAKLEEYTEALKEADGDTKEIIESQLAKHTKRKGKYEAMQRQLEESGDTQISTSDPDSRQMITRNNITEVAYNVQTTVDEQHKLIVDYEVTNQNDSKAMGSMLESACEILETNEFVALYDKGYHTGSEFKTAAELDVDVMVAIPDVASNAPDKKYNVEHFTYHYQNDCYTCPQGETLNTTGTWHNKQHGKTINRMKQYRTVACKGCPVRSQCTKNPKGRVIERTEHAQYIEHNKYNIESHDAIYKMRQSIVEHPYGTIKRQWGFCHIMTKRFTKRASADVGMMMLCYNLRRLMNILDPNVFKMYLKQLGLFIFKIMTPIKPKSAQIRPLFFPADRNLSLNRAA